MTTQCTKHAIWGMPENLGCLRSNLRGGFGHALNEKFQARIICFHVHAMKSFATSLRFSESVSKNIGPAKAGLALMEITPCKSLSFCMFVCYSVDIKHDN